jgi:3',5'-nucleoside bisphosphate phosphatase
MRVDLHLHSHVSDGHFSPAELVRAAIAGRLDLIALTDHDTAAGVAAAMREAEGTPLQVVPGIEVSTRWQGGEPHVLGYWIDPASPPILEHQAASVRRRVERMRRMVEKLRELGIPITYEEVTRAAGPARSIGRPHLARALVAAGHIRTFGEAFERYISDAGPAFVSQDFPSPEAAIAMIHAAGGVAVWAHPPLDAFAEQVHHFKAWGIDGIECFRPHLDPAAVATLEATARDLGLFPTGGSDWHGAHRSALGDFAVAGSQVPELLAAGGAFGDDARDGPAR